MSRPLLCAVALLFVLPVASSAKTVPLDSDRWEIRARESRIVDHLGRKALLLKGGIAALRDSSFADGTLEFDIAFGRERGFVGAVWRLQDFANYEEFYIRPHQSGNPDANQYQPVVNGNTAWQLYYGESYSTPITYDFDTWTHVKIVVAGAQAEIYVKDMATPALDVDLKRDATPGRVGLSAGDFAPAYYSNFSFSAAKPEAMKGNPKPEQPAPPGTVVSWAVSNAFDGNSLAGKFRLDPADKRSLTWTKLACEKTGVANLGRVHGVDKGKDTVFARVIIHSDGELVKRVRFGFSDAVKVYFNDRLICGGSDEYRSRDYRFLGTLGLYDDVYLPLAKGENELWFAVTEGFGGWGVKAVIDDSSGITIR